MTNKNKTLIALALILALGFGLVIGTHFTQLAMTDTVTSDTADELPQIDRIVLACLAEAKDNNLGMDVISLMSTNEPTPPAPLTGNAVIDKWIQATITACNDHLSIIGRQLEEVGFYNLK